MKKLVAEVMPLPNGSLYPRIYCIGPDGVEDARVSLTLCDAAWELGAGSSTALQALVDEVAGGAQAPEVADLAHMSVNDKLIWIVPPWAPLGGICVSNENVPELSSDEGTPQRFTLQQLRLAVALASGLAADIARKGRENLAGHRVEIDFPDE